MLLTKRNSRATNHNVYGDQANGSTVASEVEATEFTGAETFFENGLFTGQYGNGNESY